MTRVKKIIFGAPKWVFTRLFLIFFTQDTKNVFFHEFVPKHRVLLLLVRVPKEVAIFLSRSESDRLNYLPCKDHRT